VSLSEPIRTITTKDQWAIDSGRKYRPLTIRENARAMGFPDSYSWPEHATRGECITGLGNAVPPPVARRAIQAVQRALG
jgi:site-specific DNA-cytosine methylase